MIDAEDLDHDLEIAERHLAVLRELGAIAMTATRAYGASAAASAKAVEAVIGDECWQPQSDRTLALSGSRDAADALHKVSRVVRLTLMLEKRTAVWRRDLLTGMIRKEAGQTPAGREMDLDRWRAEGSSSEGAPDRDGATATSSAPSSSVPTAFQPAPSKKSSPTCAPSSTSRPSLTVFARTGPNMPLSRRSLPPPPRRTVAERLSRPPSRPEERQTLSS